MNATEALHTRDVELRLSEAEKTIEALLSGEIDAVVDSKSSTPVLLGKAQDALREERDRAQRYLDTPDVILLALDLDGRVTLANRYACSVLGWPAAELMGRDWIETCVPLRNHAEARRRFAEMVGGTPTGGQYLVVTAAGDERMIGWRHTLLRDTAGRAIGTFSSGADITERDRAVEELRQRAHLSALGAAVGLSLARGDALASALQQCAEALVLHLGAAFARIWTLNEREGVLELQASAGPCTSVSGFNGNVPLGQFKIGCIARDRQPHVTNVVGEEPEVSDQGWAQREGMVAFAGYPLIVDGRVVGVMALFARTALLPTVISKLASVADHVALGIERHRSAEALRTAEERMRFALEAAGVGIWDKDFTSGTLEWSEILESQHGLPPGTFGGTFEAFTNCVHPDDREALAATMSKAHAAGGDFTVLYRVLLPAGPPRWLSGAGRIVHDAHGKPVRGIGICLDVTERHSLEAQYLQAQKMEAIGRLAGGVAHDFNNLLTVILGFCELLLADRDDDPHRLDIVEIQKAAMRAAGLTGQLLAFSRKQIVEPMRLDLNVVVADMKGMLGRLIGEDVRIVMGLRPGLAAILADRGQVEQIILNLAVNARDAMPKGGTLSIETADVELDEHYATQHFGVKPGAYVALTLSDTGSGMTPEVQARVFEPFFTTKEVGKGTGLGLATVHGIVSRSGGHVGVYSEIGRGTSFKVYFPRTDTAEGVADTPVPVARRRSDGATILVVEDADGLRALIGKMLRRLRYTVLAAASGEEALRLFEENPSIDVVLTDVVMPGTSGPALMTELIKQRPALNVIYMSGYTEDAIVHHGVLDPGIAFLHKPFTAERLDRKIREVLSR